MQIRQPDNPAGKTRYCQARATSVDCTAIAPLRHVGFPSCRCGSDFLECDGTVQIFAFRNGCSNGSGRRSGQAAQTEKRPIREEIGRQKRKQRIEGDYLIGRIKLNTLLNLRMLVNGYDTSNGMRPEYIHRAYSHCCRIRSTPASDQPDGMTVPLTSLTRSPMLNGGRWFSWIVRRVPFSMRTMTTKLKEPSFSLSI